MNENTSLGRKIVLREPRKKVKSIVEKFFDFRGGEINLLLTCHIMMTLPRAPKKNPPPAYEQPSQYAMAIETTWAPPFPSELSWRRSPLDLDGGGGTDPRIRGILIHSSYDTRALDIPTQAGHRPFTPVHLRPFMIQQASSIRINVPWEKVWFM